MVLGMSVREVWRTIPMPGLIFMGRRLLIIRSPRLLECFMVGGRVSIAVGFGQKSRDLVDKTC